MKEKERKKSLCCDLIFKKKKESEIKKEKHIIS
jgi:hypothetical protein